MTDIYLDENLSEYVADALNTLNKGYFRDVNVYSTKVKFGKGATDEQIIPVLGKSNSILITKDINIHRSRMQYQLCQKYKLGIFFLKPARGLDRHWEIVKMLINQWEEMIGVCKRERLPFGFEVLTRGKMRKI